MVPGRMRAANGRPTLRTGQSAAPEIGRAQMKTVIDFREMGKGDFEAQQTRISVPIYNSRNILCASKARGLEL
jgi:hypothetical protein